MLRFFMTRAHLVFFFLIGSVAYTSRGLRGFFWGGGGANLVRNKCFN